MFFRTLLTVVGNTSGEEGEGGTKAPLEVGRRLQMALSICLSLSLSEFVEQPFSFLF